MKKTLLLFAAIAVCLGASAQKSWNFSNAPFGASPTVSFAATFTHDDLTIGTNGDAVWTLDANNKTLNEVSYTNRLKSGGGGSPAEGSLLPTTRYLSINVAGNSDIVFHVMSSSSSAIRVMQITNADGTLDDSIPEIIGTSLQEYTYSYQGAATTLYFYSKNSGLNFYYMSATNLATSNVPAVLADKGISFNGNSILNTKNLNIEVYNVVGKLVASSSTDISVNNFQPGIYMVRAKGEKGVLKFIK